MPDTMNGMTGRHANGTGLRGDDGAAAVATLEAPVISTALAPQRLVPFPVPWTEARQEDAGTVDMSVDKPRLVIDGDRLRRASMWVLASGVATIAAIVSYSHIYDLGRAHGGSGTAARLLPLSVDMLILVGELMLLHEADAKGRRFVLGWVLVWSGILATLAANVSYGYQFGIAGAVIWGWPAYSFILAAAGMVSVVKRGAARDVQTPVDMPPAEVDTPAPRSTANGVDKTTVASMDKSPSITVTPRPKAPPRRQAAGADKAALDKAAAVLRSNPGITNAAAARLAKVSAKTVQRARPLAAAAPSEGG